MMVADGDKQPFLVLEDALLPWTAAGYGRPIALPDESLDILTPRSIVGAIANGFRVTVHPSATEQRG